MSEQFALGWPRPKTLSSVVLARRLLSRTVMEITCRAEAPLAALPGQYVSVKIPQPAGAPLRRSYSLAAPPDGDVFVLCVKAVEGGLVSPSMHSLEPGMRFDVLGPCGRFVYATKPHRHLCIVATGTGIAPLRAMILSKAYQEHPPLSTTCLLGVACAEEALYLADLAHTDLTVALSRAAARDPHEFAGRVTDKIRSMAADYPWKKTDFYLCGNGAMTAEARAILSQRGVPDENVRVEDYFG